MKYMKLTYYWGWDRKLITVPIVGKVTFKDGELHFSSMGHERAVNLDRIVSIESMDEE